MEALQFSLTSAPPLGTMATEMEDGNALKAKTRQEIIYSLPRWIDFYDYPFKSSLKEQDKCKTNYSVQTDDVRIVIAGYVSARTDQEMCRSPTRRGWKGQYRCHPVYSSQLHQITFPSEAWKKLWSIDWLNVKTLATRKLFPDPEDSVRNFCAKIWTVMKKSCPCSEH